MKHLNKPATKAMDILTDGLRINSGSRKIRNNPCKSIMAVHVEKIGQNTSGAVFSVSHYYELNGDLMADPDMTFLKGADGNYYPLTFQQDNLGIYRDAAIWDDNGNLKGYRPRMQADMTSFANIWMKNIKSQQRL